MNNQFDEMLRQLKNVSPPEGLNDRVIGAVRRVRRRRTIFTGTLYMALALMAPALMASLRLLITDVSTSSLAPLLDLALTDWRQVQSSLGAWLLAVFEAVPVGSLALTLGAFFLALVLIDRISSNGFVKNRNMKEAS
ncbi:MAG: hypothetical protein Q8L35_08190 [Actinomycetota bacterium]|nr:hypothetical protein [Actinomycetota bacterium]